MQIAKSKTFSLVPLFSKWHFVVLARWNDKMKCSLSFHVNFKWWRLNDKPDATPLSVSAVLSYNVYSSYFLGHPAAFVAVSANTITILTFRLHESHIKTGS